MERFALQEGIKWTMVPMKGDAETIPAVLGGHVSIGTCTGGEVAQVEAGNLRVLVILTPQRVKRWPNVPTTRELYNIYGESRWGIAGPKGMDPKVVKILHDAFKKGLEDPTFLERSAKLVGMDPAYLNSEDYAKHAAQEYEGRRIEAIQFDLKKKFGSK